MRPETAAASPPPHTLLQAYRDRLRVLSFPLALMIGIGALLRLTLYAAFHSGPFAPGALLLALAAGVVYDALVATVLLGPALLLVAVLRARPLGWPPLRFVLSGIFGTAVAFGAAVEYDFFEEFNSRLNHIALDYLLHPKEVFGNIRDSYDVPLALGLAVACGIGTGLLALAWTRGARFERLPWAVRGRGALAAVGLVAFAGGALELLPGEVSGDRIVSEIAQNGLDRLVHAFRTGHLDYDLYYRTMPSELAAKRAGAVLGHATSVPPAALAAAAGAGLPKPWDVVVIVEESLGSEFIGVLGHADRRTSPGFDRWSREGLLLTNLTATGNRTVRGLEGTLCSFVPLPGDSILTRLRSHGGVPTLAEVLRRRGYRTAFLYGGWGSFDAMKPFFPENGVEEFIDRDTLPDGTFRTIWGVADEYAFDRLLKRQKDAAARGERLFATLLTVSNHKPYDVPERPTAWPATRRDRNAAVAYADWALARYLDQARDAGLLEHTVVLVIGDHGARVYGSEEIPAASYRIPGLFLVPGDAWRGRRVERLASQIDLAPTLLALLHQPPAPPFMGVDVTRLPADGGRAFLLHNRDVGILTDDALVTLGLQRRVTCYRRAGRGSDVFEPAGNCGADSELQGLEDDATAVFQYAYESLRAGRFALPPDSRIAAAPRAPLAKLAPVVREAVDRLEWPRR